jgi:chaperonin cofactor prefoldin
MKNSMKITDRIKLMMSYNNKKTLNENLQENNIINEEETNIDEGPATAKEIGNLFKDASKSKGDFKGITNAIEKDVKLGQSVGSKFNLTVDQVKEALASERGVLNNIDKSIENEFINGYRIGKTGVVAKEVQQASQQLALRRVMETGKSEGRVLSEVEIQSIIERTKAETAAKVRQYEKNVKGGVIPNPTKDYVASEKNLKGKLKASEAENARFKEELKNNANQSKESAAGTSAAAAANSALTPEVKAVAQEASTVVKEMKPSRYQRWKEWAKKNPKTNKALIFLGLTATGWVLYKMFSSNDRKDEVKKTLFANCAGDLLDTENSKILTMEDGSPVIGVSPTGNKEYDSKKGLKFFSNNRVLSGDNTMRGTWGCKGSTIGVQSEQTGLPGVDLGLGTLSRIAQNREINKAESVGNVLNKINITWDTKSTDGGGGGKDNGSGGGGTKNTIPTELKDVDGVKKFQTWLDSKHGGWHTKYGTLNDNTLKGWGKYGPNTTKAWSQYKDEYLNGSTASGTETPIPSTGVDVTKPSGIPGSPDMVGKSGLNLDVNRIKVTNQDVNNEIDKKIQPSNTELTDREKEILSNVKSRGADKVYKGGTLTPEEQQWLSKYYGGVIRKIKNEKGYGQKTVIDVPKKDDTSNEPLNEENIIKKIVSKNLKSLIK